MNYIKIITVSAFCLFIARISQAQKTSSGQLWADVNYAHFISSKFSIGGMTGARTDIGDTNWNSIFICPGASYRLNEKFTLEGNIGLFQVWNESSPNSLELRLAQATKFEWPKLKRIDFKNRFRLEERYFMYQSSGDDETIPPNKWSFRLRYRITAQTHYFNISEKLKNFYGSGFLEIFIPVSDPTNEEFSNRNRVGFGFGQLMQKGHHYEVDLFWQNSKNETSSAFTTDQWVLRLRYYIKTLGKF